MVRKRERERERERLGIIDDVMVLRFQWVRTGIA